ncbi:hypothetical protein [Phytoactinopolyspora mesophila]|uniref:Cupin domain-containing protein n=1 Tax=Phytoactinopolyspora mesophila TaxID=2650750 RepID=A0A7K3MDB7_9ACTN|nr:hypothetical protein [Phytoactinopolyspora mesophila]NDL60398.1 hypothetical protein [Phytoactinopolyspora mesophila]
MKAALDELRVEYEGDGFELRAGRWGDMAVARMTLSPGFDLAPGFAVLPDGLCSGDHYGVVLDGDITLRYTDGSQETTRAGECFYWPAGHTAFTDRGVVVVMVTPLAQIEHMEKLMAEAAGKAGNGSADG